jgi:DNA-binding transcriptional LysR family regulator
MIARTQYTMNAADLEVVLAVVRARNLSEAGKRLGVAGSTIFRSIKRLEKGLGQQLFARSRKGSHPTEIALQLARHAERIEEELESVLSITQGDRDGLVSGSVKLATTDTVLHGLILPILADIQITQPLLQFELTTSNEFTSLAKREADIALRVTREPPEFLIGKHIGKIRMALFGPRAGPVSNCATADLALCNWVAPDDTLPNHSSVRWRQRVYPSVTPRYTANSVLSVSAAIAAGLGVGMIPLFLARNRNDMVQLSEPIDECESELWLLIRTESRHISRVSATYSYLANHLSLE